MPQSPCPSCGSKNVFKTVKPVSAGGGYAPNYLPGLGIIWSAGKFEVVLCQECGLTRFYAARDALAKLSQSSKWQRL